MSSHNWKYPFSNIIGGGSSLIVCLLLCIALISDREQGKAAQNGQQKSDWTQMGNGPERTFYTSAAIYPPLKRKKQWRVESNGNWAPPVVQGSKFYIVEQKTFRERRESPDYVVQNRIGVLDLATGKVVWAQAKSEIGVSHSSTPAIVREGIICVPSAERSGRPGAWQYKPSWAAVRALDGTVLWEFANRSERLVSPVVTEGLLYTGIGAGGSLAAVDVMKGQQQWDVALSQVGDTHNPVDNAAVMAASRSHHFLVATAPHWLITVDTKERKVIDALYWWNEGISQPSVSEGRIYFLGILRYDSKVPDPDGKMRSLIGLHCLGSKVKKERFWSVEGGVTIKGTLQRFNRPLFLQHLVVGPHEVIAPIEGGIACLEKKTGKLRWAKALSGHYTMQEMIMCRDVLYVTEAQEPNPQKKSLFYLTALDVRTGKQLQRLRLEVKPPVYLMATTEQIILSEQGRNRDEVQVLVLGK